MLDYVRIINFLLLLLLLLLTIIIITVGHTVNACNSLPTCQFTCLTESVAVLIVFLMVMICRNFMSVKCFKGCCKLSVY